MKQLALAAIFVVVPMVSIENVTAMSPRLCLGYLCKRQCK
jgi:hypothetical protein